MKTVAVFHNQVSRSSHRDDLDVLVQCECVEEALRELGAKPVRVPFGLDLEEAGKRLRKIAPAAVFNLSESVADDGRLISLASSLLDHLGLPYSGCPTDAVYVTSNKLLGKKWLRLLGIRTPDWYDLEEREGNLMHRIASRYIIKSSWEHASNWFSDESIVEAGDIERLHAALQGVRDQKKAPYYAERYIPGREFNVSILAGRVLPIPEIIFSNFPEGKLPVVDFRAKWDESSFEYRNTNRCFELPAEDRHLLRILESISLECWQRFNLRGYARVDFRVDPGGIPWVIEINSNPCLSPDAGFFASARQAGLSPAQMVRQILADSGIEI
jgi:D-alanine-D-alanine ligase